MSEPQGSVTGTLPALSGLHWGHEDYGWALKLSAGLGDSRTEVSKGGHCALGLRGRGSEGSQGYIARGCGVRSQGAGGCRDRRMQGLGGMQRARWRVRGERSCRAG